VALKPLPWSVKALPRRKPRVTEKPPEYTSAIPSKELYKYSYYLIQCKDYPDAEWRNLTNPTDDWYSLIPFYKQTQEDIKNCNSDTKIRLTFMETTIEITEIQIL